MNKRRLAKARECLKFARELRLGTIPVVKWRGRAAQALTVAGEERRDAWKPWDHTVKIWVCQCCMLVEANGECCADDTHGGDSMVPLSGISPDDRVSLGLLEEEHSERCTPADREEGCDCAENSFSTAQCDGCDSWLAGTRHAMTLWVGEGRAAVSLVKAA